MTRASTRRLARFLPGAILLLAAGLFAPSRADAGCVHPGLKERGLASLSPLGSLDVLDLSAAESLLGSPDTPAPRRPCSGPTCSENREVPSSMPTPSAPRGDLFCSTSLRPPLDPLPFRHRILSSDVLVLIELGTDLERPPRFPA